MFVYNIWLSPNGKTEEFYGIYASQENWPQAHWYIVSVIMYPPKDDVVKLDSLETLWWGYI